VALSPDKALEAAKNIVFGPRMVEAERLNRIAMALSPRNQAGSPSGMQYLADAQGGVGYVTVEMPPNAPKAMQHLALKARTNFLPLVVDTFAQNMKVDGIISSANPGEQSAVWKYGWQANNLDARQTGVHRSALAYGASYVTVLPGTTGPVIKGVSPRQMTAVYQDPVDDDWPMLAVRVDGDMIRLYDEEQVYFIGVEQAGPRSGFGASLAISTGVKWDFIEARAHGVKFAGQPVCPVIRFRDRMLLEGEEQYGIVEPLLDIQRRIDETTFGMLVAQYYAAFKQRYVIGWVPKTEQEALKASAAEFWAFADGDVKVGEFTETDLTRYIGSKDSALQDMAAIAQLPAQGLGVSGIHNVSAEALALIAGNQERKGGELTTSTGESWEMVARTAASIQDDQATANDESLEVRWKDTSTQSLAQTVDALGKMSQMLGVPDEVLWSKIPAFTDQDIERARRAVTQQDLLAQLQQTTAAATVPTVQRTANPT
jgi:hypothetical protein